MHLPSPLSPPRYGPSSPAAESLPPGPPWHPPAPTPAALGADAVFADALSAHRAGVGVGAHHGRLALAVHQRKTGVARARRFLRTVTPGQREHGGEAERANEIRSHRSEPREVGVSDVE